MVPSVLIRLEEREKVGVTWLQIASQNEFSTCKVKTCRGQTKAERSEHVLQYSLSPRIAFKKSCIAECFLSLMEGVSQSKVIFLIYLVKMHLAIKILNKQTWRVIVFKHHFP